MPIFSKIVAGILLFFLFSFNTMFYTVDQREFAIVFQFGEAVKVRQEAGLYLKIPFIQNVEFYDNRILNVLASAKELTASDGKRVIVDSYAFFKIVDPVKFYATVQNYAGINLRLNRILESSMRKIIGKVPLSSLLSSSRSLLMHQIWEMLNNETISFGVEVVDVRIIRADLPKENSAAIYKRMQTEREREAKKIRAEGLEESAKIRSSADKERTIILSEAYKSQQIIEGEGDASAISIYNKAYGQDPEFFSFLKSIEAYDFAFKEDNTTFVLPTNSSFFNYLGLESKK